jgi:hypothetical protein
MEVGNQYKETLDEILRICPYDHVVDMDETSWKWLNHGFVTLAERGRETVK